VSLLTAVLGAKPARKKPAEAAPRPKRAVRSAGSSVAGSAAHAILASPDFGRAVVLALLVASGVAVADRVRARLEAEPCLSLDRRELALMPLPSFLSERARGDLAALPLPERVSALRDDLVPAVARSLELVPWVEEVASVRLEFSAERELEPSLRFSLKAARPIARVSERGYELFVTRSRRRVPPDRFAALSRALPRIEGLPDETSPERERALEDGLAVVAALDRKNLTEKLGVSTVSLANRLRRDQKASEIELVLASGTRVEWGRAAEAPGSSVEDRLARLEAFCTRGPALSQVERLSVRWDDPVYVLKPIAADADARSP